MIKKRKVHIYPILLLIKCYKLFISPWITACRFMPTCSEYSMEAFEKFGLFKGFYLTLKRLSRCHPWGGCGFDPVTQEKKIKKLKVAHNKRNVYKSEKKKELL